jgi:hypothetical protein
MVQGGFFEFWRTVILGAKTSSLIIIFRELQIKCPLTQPLPAGSFFNFYFILLINTCCVKGWNCTLNLCSQRVQIYYLYHINFLRCLFGFALFYSFHCLLVFYLFISRLLSRFPIYFGYVKFFLQQSTCIVIISCIVGFALFCCCLLILYLFISFIVVWVFYFFVFVNIFSTILFFKYKY